jgi:hypothetical protein
MGKPGGDVPREVFLFFYVFIRIEMYPSVREVIEALQVVLPRPCQVEPRDGGPRSPSEQRWPIPVFLRQHLFVAEALAVGGYADLARLRGSRLPTGRNIGILIQSGSRDGGFGCHSIISSRSPSTCSPGASRCSGSQKISPNPRRLTTELAPLPRPDWSRERREAGTLLAATNEQTQGRSFRRYERHSLPAVSR